MRALCLHGHFYQPPREHPWLGVVEPDVTAAPERDWNTRITAECYAPNAAARVLDAHGGLVDLVDNYEWTGFNFGPTLLAWMEANAPETLAALRRADAAGRSRTGHGNAWAQAYGHPILPLSTPRDVHTQVYWGRRDFEHRFGRPPDGMWLPEMAVDATALAALARCGLSLTILSPHQARRVRPLGGTASDWRDVTPDTLDTRRLYRCIPAPGLAVDVAFREPILSHDLSFGGLLTDGATLAARLRAALGADDGPALVTLAVDGETYGHHHRFGEMALAWALRDLRRDPDVALVGPAAFRAVHPPVDEVEIVDGTSWSCAHGVERWRADCGCTVSDHADWNQAWRAPLRAAIDWLRDVLAPLYEERAGDVFRDPWGARDRYVDCLLDPRRTAAFVGAEASGPLSPAATVQARRALELARHALFMQTSCGWFFDELTRVEPVLVLRHAARAIDLAAALGARFEDDFVARLEPARSNLPGAATGADVYRQSVRGAAATPPRVAASGAILALLDQPVDVPGYEVRLPAAGDGAVAGAAEVVERTTGGSATVVVAGERTAGAPPVCLVAGERFMVGDLFGVQKEALTSALARDAARSARVSGRNALGGMRAILEPLLEGEVRIPIEIAMLLGWEAVDAIAAALEQGAPLAPLVAETAALRARGARFPNRWLAPRLGRALEAVLATLPDGATRALQLLDLAEAAAVPLDLARAQVLAMRWWLARPGNAPVGATVAALADRLNLAPEAGGGA